MQLMTVGNIVGMHSGLSFCWSRLVAGQTYPKLFHLFFLQARGVKIEASRQVQGSGGGRRRRSRRRRQDYVEVMPPQTNRK